MTERWPRLDRCVRSVEATKMLASVSDRTLGHLVTERWRVASGCLCGSALGRHRVTRRWVSPIEHDWTRPVMISRFWMPTRNDQTLRSSVRSLHSSASGHHLTVGIGRSIFEERDDVIAIR